MAVFTDAELGYLAGQRLARLATASTSGQPDVSAVGFTIEGDTIVSGGMDITKTVRYRHLRENPQATVVIDDLPADVFQMTWPSDKAGGRRPALRLVDH